VSAVDLSNHEASPPFWNVSPLEVAPTRFHFASSDDASKSSPYVACSVRGRSGAASE
jgi:hypothetical protein